MRTVNLALQRFTTYGLLATILLSLVGFWVILFTFPNLFYTLSGSGLPTGMAWMIDRVRGLAGSVVDAQRNALMSTVRLPMAAILPYVLWGLVAAALVRSARAKSWQPTSSVIVHLSVGIISFPLFAWVAQVTIWLATLGSTVLNWITALLANGVARIIGFVALGIVGLGLAAFAVYLLTQSVRARWTTAGILTVGIALFLARDSILPPVISIANAIAGFLGTVFGFAILILLGIVFWGVTLFVLAYVGGTVVTPLRDAFTAGRQPDRLADLAAGVGVAVSVLVMAASYSNTGRGNFEQFLTSAEQMRHSLPLGSLPNVLDLRFDAVLPHSLDPIMHNLFVGFNGALDLMVIAIACVVGIITLTFSSGSLNKSESMPTILTMAFLRVPLILLVAVVALWLTASTDAE